MPTPTKYTYSIANDTANGVVDPTTLTSEIAASSISIALDYISTSGDVLDIWMKDVLSGTDQTTLTSVVNAHEGFPSPTDEPAVVGGFKKLKRRFGNLTAASTSEVLVSARTYSEQATAAQRSVKSTSANDADPAGTGAKQVRLVYLDSNYVEKTEDITLNGILAVNTVATDIRFVQDFFVIKGAAAAGAIELFTLVGGAGTAICGIPTGTEQAFFCHYYVPAGKRIYIARWGSVVDDEVSLKLKGQTRYNGNLVDTNIDLEKLFGGNPTPPTRLAFERELNGVVLHEKTYARVTVVPNQSTSTVIRSYMYFWEENDL